MKQPHIQCCSEDVAKMVILPGDPDRVKRVAMFLDEYNEIAYNREFRTITGKYKGMEVTITSTGIGGASACIALEELIACGGTHFIRIGSSGAVQSHVNIGDLIIATGAIREDGASKMYVKENYPAVSDHELVNTIKNNAEKLNYNHHLGIVRSHDSFYIDHEKELMDYWSEKGILGSDMETATLMVVGSLRGAKIASILNNVVLYDGNVKDGINDYVDNAKLAEEGERREIILALESLLEIHKNNALR
ncbi:nucleoside phosphorylase [Lutibacter sp. B2]|nr:nucleoside phosphorylase [Lutibacter sp. B2]